MVAFPLAPFLTRAGITALGAGAAGEGIKSLQNINPDVAEQAFLRTIIGPISDIFNRTTDTPSGKVFAPTGEVIEPNQIPGIAPPEQQQGITGLPIPEKAPGLPGLINPEQVDTSILNKEETEDSPILTENLTEKESKYLTELLTDTGGGKFEAEILQEVPSLMIKDNKLIIKQKDLNSFDKFLDELYIGEKAPSGKGADTIPPRLRGFGDFDTSVVGKLFKNTTEQPVKPEEIKNQIKTWEIGDFKSIEEAKQKAEEAGVTFEDLELAAIQRQIKFKKARYTDGYDVFFDGKLIGNLDDRTSEQVEAEGKRFRGMRTFNLGFLTQYGDTEAIDTYEGVENSKQKIKEYIAKELLRKDSKELVQKYGFGLRRIFEDTKYDKKGYPITEENTSKSAGSLIDKPLSDENN